MDRLEHTKPVVSRFFQGCRDQLEDGGLLTSDPLSKTVNYVLSREASLTVFLEDPDVQPDTPPQASLGLLFNYVNSNTSRPYWRQPLIPRICRMTLATHLQ